MIFILILIGFFSACDQLTAGGKQKIDARYCNQLGIKSHLEKYPIPYSHIKKISPGVSERKVKILFHDSLVASVSLLEINSLLSEEKRNQMHPDSDFDGYIDSIGNWFKSNDFISLPHKSQEGVSYYLVLSSLRSGICVSSLKDSSCIPLGISIFKPLIDVVHSCPIGAIVDIYNEASGESYFRAPWIWGVSRKNKYAETQDW